jgi:hypothetical protein
VPVALSCRTFCYAGKVCAVLAPAKAKPASSTDAAMTPFDLVCFKTGILVAELDELAPTCGQGRRLLGIVGAPAGA